MKRWFLLSVLGISMCLFQTSSAGVLRFGSAFINAITPFLKLQKADCLESMISDPERNYWCGSTPITVKKFQAIYDAKAAAVAKKASYIYRKRTGWIKSAEFKGAFIRIDALNGINVTFAVFPLGVGQSFTFFSVDQLEDSPPLSASQKVSPEPETPNTPSGANQAPPEMPQTPAVETIVQTPTPVISTEVTVVRYLCQPWNNDFGRAFGTLRNTGTQTLENLRYNVEFFNESTLVGQISGAVQATRLAPSAESTFQALGKTPEYTRCELSFEDSSGKITTKLP